MSRSVVREISRDIGNAAEGIAEQLKQGVEHETARMQEAMAEAAVALSKAAQDIAEAARKHSRAGKKQAVREIREHPLATSLIIFAAAVLVGGLILRQR